MTLDLKYEGLNSDKHRLEIFTGTQSLEGFGRAFQIIGHYAVTGKVRRRAPFTNDLEFYLSTPKPGSVSFTIDLATIAGVGLAFSSTFDLKTLYEFANFAFRLGTGQTIKTLSSSIEAFTENKSGDMKALAKAIEPALKRGHAVIGHSADKIVIVGGTNNTVNVNFDTDTKAYLEGNRTGDIETRDVSIASYSALQKSVLAYLLDENHTVRYKLSSASPPGTGSILSRSLDDYERQRGASVSVRYVPTYTRDGRLTHMLILEAWSLKDLI